MKRSACAPLAVAALVVTVVHPAAQTKKALTVDDYTKWKSIGDTAISGDGKWVAYVLRTTNVPDDQARPVLHLLNLETNQDVTVENATGGTFSADSAWIAYQIDPAPGRGRGRSGRGPAPSAPPSSDPAVPPGAPAPPAPDAATTTQGAQGGSGATGGTGTQAARGGNADAPAPPRRVEVRSLATGVVQS